MTAPTERPVMANPTPVRYHDHHPAVAALAEYHQARAALDRLVHAIADINVEMTQGGWIEMAGDMAASNVYGDRCRQPHEDNAIVYPHRLQPAGAGSVRAYYRCAVHGRTWSVGWAIDAPVAVGWR